MAPDRQMRGDVARRNSSRSLRCRRDSRSRGSSGDLRKCSTTGAHNRPDDALKGNPPCHPSLATTCTRACARTVPTFLLTITRLTHHRRTRVLTYLLQCDILPLESSLPFLPCGASRTRGKESRIPRRYVAWIVLAAAMARRTFRHAVTRVSSCPRNERASPAIPLSPCPPSLSISASSSPSPFLSLAYSSPSPFVLSFLCPSGDPSASPDPTYPTPIAPRSILDSRPRFCTRRAELRSEWIYSRER